MGDHLKSESQNFDTLKLAIEAFSCGDVIPMTTLANLKCRVDVDRCYDLATSSMLVQVVAYLLATNEISQDKVRITGHEFVPQDWWQALRERWFPDWYLRRWPVKRRSIPVHTRKMTIIRRMCPHIAVSTDRRHFEWLAEQKKSYEQISKGG